MTSIKDVPKFDKSDFENGASEESAKLESQAFAEGNYDKIAAQKKHQRQQSFHTHIHYWVLIFIWVIGLIVIASAIVWSWHMLTPVGYHFLNPTQIDKLQTSFLISVVSGVTALLARQKYLEQ